MSSTSSLVESFSNSISELDVHQLLSMQTILRTRLVQLISPNQFSHAGSVPADRVSEKFCLFHLKCKHCTEECRVIKRLISREQATCQVNHTNVGVPAQVLRKRYKKRRSSKSKSKSKDVMQRTYCAVVQSQQLSSSAQGPHPSIAQSPVTSAGAKGKFSKSKPAVRNQDSGSRKHPQGHHKRAQRSRFHSTMPSTPPAMRRGPPASPPSIKRIQLMPPAASTEVQPVQPSTSTEAILPTSVKPTESPEASQGSAVTVVRVLESGPAQEPVESLSQEAPSRTESCPDGYWEDSLGSDEKIERLRQTITEYRRRNAEQLRTRKDLPEDYRGLSFDFCM